MGQVEKGMKHSTPLQRNLRPLTIHITSNRVSAEDPGHWENVPSSSDILFPYISISSAIRKIKLVSCVCWLLCLTFISAPWWCPGRNHDLSNMDHAPYLFLISFKYPALYLLWFIFCWRIFCLLLSLCWGLCPSPALESLFTLIPLHSISLLCSCRSL